uniref:Uncharacterized protein n=1 Tax=Anguilla anguilla TaxID=7936 RepID=A0A0E9VL10_ANGAN
MCHFILLVKPPFIKGKKEKYKQFAMCNEYNTCNESGST